MAKNFVRPNMLLALNSESKEKPTEEAEMVKEPAFGLPAYWIKVDERHDAEQKKFTLFEPSTVIATHFSEIIKRNANLILGREEVQKMDELKDPVMTLICANRMKKFTPKQGILSEEQHKNLVEGIKKTVSTIVRNSDLDKFEPEEKATILEMVQKIENSDSVEFGIEKQLKALVDKLNSKKLKLGFIPPVQVRDLVQEGNKILKKKKKILF